MAGRTLSAKRWHASFSEDGHLDIALVLSRIQRGGVHPTIKGPVWEFLLGCFDPDSTFDERSQLRQNRKSEYDTLKSTCKKKKMDPTIGSGKLVTTPVITEDGQPAEDPSDKNTSPKEEGDKEDITIKDKDVIQWKLTLHQIGLDVVRTDRTLVYYENEKKSSQSLGYFSSLFMDRHGHRLLPRAGMSDLCSPISMLVENEADAFWCFERLMRRTRGNFKCTTGSLGVRSQLTELSSIMQSVDPKLHEHIENLDGGEYLFAFRMSMVLFRREFSFVDTLYLWEVMWAMEYNPKLFSMYESDAKSSNTSSVTSNGGILKQYGKFERKNLNTQQSSKSDQHTPLSIFLVASVLEAQNKKLLQEAKGLDDVVKILNDLTGNLDAKKACNNALKIHSKHLTKVKSA